MKRLTSILCVVVMIISLCASIVVPAVAETVDLSDYTVEYKTQVTNASSSGNFIFAVNEVNPDADYFYVSMNASSSQVKLGHYNTGKSSHTLAQNGGTATTNTGVVHETPYTMTLDTTKTYAVKVVVTDAGTDAATAKLWVAEDGAAYTADPLVTILDSDLDAAALGFRHVDYSKPTTTEMRAYYDDLKVTLPSGAVVYQNDFSVAHPFWRDGEEIGRIDEGRFYMAPSEEGKNIEMAWLLADLIQYNTETFTIEYEEAILEGFPGFVFSGTGEDDHFIIHPKPELDIIQVFHLGEEAKSLHKFTDRDGELVEKALSIGNHSVSAPYDFEMDGRAYKFKVVITPATETEIGVAKIYINDSAEPVVTFKDSMITYGMIGTRICSNGATDNSVASKDKAYFDNLKITDAFGTLIYANDFSSYNFLTDSWMENGKVYQEWKSGGVLDQFHMIDDIIAAEKAFDPATYAGDYSIRYDTEILETAQFGCVSFGVNSSSDYCYIQTNRASNEVKLYHYNGDKTSHTANGSTTTGVLQSVIKSVPVDGEVVSIRVDVTGVGSSDNSQAATIYANGTYLGKLADSEIGYGNVGLSHGNLNNATPDGAYYDNLKVTTINGTPIYENDFSAKNPFDVGSLENGRLLVNTKTEGKNTHSYLTYAELIARNDAIHYAANYSGNYTIEYETEVEAGNPGFAFGDTNTSSSNSFASVLADSNAITVCDYKGSLNGNTPGSTANKWPGTPAISRGKVYSVKIEVIAGTSAKMTVSDGTNSHSVTTASDFIFGGLGFRHLDSGAAQAFYDNIVVTVGGSVIFEEDFNEGINPFGLGTIVDGRLYPNASGTQVNKVIAISTLLQNQLAAQPAQPEQPAAADYTAVEEAIANASILTAGNYVDFSGVTNAIAAVDYTKLAADQATVNGYAAAIEAAIAALELKPADYTALNAAIAKYDALTIGNYTEATAKAATDSYNIAKADSGRKITDQAVVTMKATNLENAITALVLKDADYSAVNTAKERAEALNANYYDATEYAKVTAAVNAVVEGKKITEQSEVDAMAEAINDAIDALVMLDANYTAAYAAKQEAAAVNRDLYTPESLAALDAAVNAVVDGKKIDEQAVVDGWAADIRAAIEDLDLIPVAEPALEITVPDEIVAGQEVEVVVGIKDNTHALTGMLLDVTFDPEYLEIESVEDVVAGDMGFEIFVGIEDITDTTATVSMVDGTLEGISTASGSLVKITFKAKKDGTTTVTATATQATNAVPEFIEIDGATKEIAIDAPACTHPEAGLDYRNIAGTDTHIQYCTACDVNVGTAEPCDGTYTTVAGATNTAKAQHSKTCSICENVKTVDCSYGEGVVTGATCTEAGYTTYTCSVATCGHTYTVAGEAALDHDWGAWGEAVNDVHTRVCGRNADHTDTIDCDYEDVVTPPTCDDGGYTTHTCTVTGTAHSYTDTPTDAKGHDWDDGVVTDDPTCEDPGVKTFTCKNDSTHTYTEDVDALGHDWGNWTHVADTATHTRVCGNDDEHTETVGCVTEQTGTIGHTCTEAGKLVYTCTEECGYSYTETNPADPAAHTYDEGAYTGPTCTEDAYTTYTCSVCDENTAGHIKVETEAGTATNHPNKTEDTNDNLDLINGFHVHLFDCPDCDEMLDDIEYTLEEVYTEPTCVEDGYTTYTCPACEKFEDVTDVGSADGEHDYTGVEGVYVAPTPAEDGHWERDCVDCDHIEKYDYDNSLLGDVNGDGKVSIADAVVLLRHVNNSNQAAGITVNEYAGDVDGDDLLTDADVERIMQFLNGWNVTLVAKVESSEEE